MQRATPGDVFEIATKRGLAYAQFTHRHPQYSQLIRVLRGVFDTRPDDLSALVSADAAFVTFFPLDGASKKGVVELVAHYPIPPEALAFPVFRTGIPDRTTRKVATWWFWDGEKEWMVGSITEAQRSMPIRAILTLPTLVDRIEAGWTPARDLE